MPSKVYLRILQSGVVASLFIVFLVFRDLLFPFITSKQLVFNILMEALLAVWLVFILRYPAYRPKKSYLSLGLGLYFIAIFASIFVSYDPALSFWGDAERMLGLFHLLHFLILYLILITAFRSWAEWRWLFLVSLAVAVAISVIGIRGEAYSRIGNTAYVSAYLIFNLFFAALLFIRSKSPWRWLLVLALGPLLWEFSLARTSGAIVGLAASLLVFVWLLSFWYQERSRRLAARGVFLFLLLSIVLVFSQSGRPWFQDSFLKELTPQKDTFQTRLISWRGAAAEFNQHWLFGVGFGNYAVIFDRQFDPIFYNYDRQETYFDRAHNNLIEIASTTGLVGLLAYLSIFAAAAYYLSARYRSSGEESPRYRLEVLVIFTLLLAYFIQNLAVFDSYVTYFGLMLVLAYIFWLANPPEGQDAAPQEARPRRFVLGPNWELLSLIALLSLSFLVISQFNLKPWRMLRGVIDGYTSLSERNLVGAVSEYKAALSGTPLDRDGRGTLVNWLVANPGALSEMSYPQAEAILSYVISLAKKNVSHNEYDSLAQMQLAQVLDVAARYHYQNLSLFNYYSSQAIQAIDLAIESSPRRPTIYIAKSQLLLSRGEKEAALESLAYAISLNRDFPDGHCRLAQSYFFLLATDKSGDNDYQSRLKEPLDRCIDLGGVADIYSPTILAQALSYYAPRGDYPRALVIAERLVRLESREAGAWLNLARLYQAAGYRDLAARAYQQAAALDEDIAPDFLDGLEE